MKENAEIYSQRTIRHGVPSWSWAERQDDPMAWAGPWSTMALKSAS